MAQAHATLASEQSYILGHTERELNRLIDQSRYFGDLTAHVFQLAGLAPGMRVLDVGCGAGDVSFLAASIVGPAGEVIGVDRSADAVALARQRATAAGLTNVSFVVDDIAELTLPEPVDALIGRLILMYLADPAVVLRRLASNVRPGGVVAFQEMDMEAAQALPSCPLFEVAIQRIAQTFVRVGAQTRAGLHLGPIFQEAGLPAPRMILGAQVEHGPNRSACDQISQITRTLLPMMQRTGVATAEEVDIETLAARLRAEAIALDATQVSPSLVGAWTHTSSPAHRVEAAR